MTYILIMTEGNSELAFLNVILEKGLLKFDKKELLTGEIKQCRKIEGEVLANILMLSPNDNVTIYRVGDKLSDTLKTPKIVLPQKIKAKYDICTLPEFEILFILKENYYAEFSKAKTGIKANEFYRKKNKKYKKQSEFITDYFSKMSNDEIIELINIYISKRGKVHQKNQLTLKEIIKC